MQLAIVAYQLGFGDIPLNHESLLQRAVPYFQKEIHYSWTRFFIIAL